MNFIADSVIRKEREQHSDLKSLGNARRLTVLVMLMTKADRRISKWIIHIKQMKCFVAMLFVCGTASKISKFKSEIQIRCGKSISAAASSASCSLFFLPLFSFSVSPTIYILLDEAHPDNDSERTFVL